MATALSDTEVEVKDRLSSKLWEWSADSSRHLSSNEVCGLVGPFRVGCDVVCLFLCVCMCVCVCVSEGETEKSCRHHLY